MLDDPIPISALQHAVYCLRQAALIHVERMWEENRFTAEGRVVHDKVHEATGRRLRSVRRVTGLHVASLRLGISGVADLVEFRQCGTGEVAYPVEFKRGKPKAHRADEVQLCAQSLCLEEMTGGPVPEGALYYAELKRRTPVVFDAELRAATEAVAARLRELFRSGLTPPAIYEPRKCNGCSLIEVCRPKLSGRSAEAWTAAAIATMLDGEAGS